MANQRAWLAGGAASAEAGSWFEVAVAKERVDRERRITPTAVALRAMAESSNRPYALVADEELPVRYVDGLSHQRRHILSAKYNFDAANLVNYIRGYLGS
jgi:hypothetical protein